MPAPTTASFCTSAKQELLEGIHDFQVAGDTFKVALLNATPTATYNASVTNYGVVTTNSDEAAVGGGTTPTSSPLLSALTLTNVAPTTSGTTAYCDFDDITITISNSGGADPTLTSSGMMIYNDTNAAAATKESISIHNFTGPPTASGPNATFTITFPTANATDAIIRLA